MDATPRDTEKLSPWWRNGVILVMIVGFSILIGLTVRSYRDAPPVPDQVLDPSGNVVFTGNDVRAGQQVFLKYGLMENGTVWGHGAYLGPDFSAAYLHALSAETGEAIARERFNRIPGGLDAAERDAVNAETGQLLKQNRYDSHTETLIFTPQE